MDLIRIGMMSLLMGIGCSAFFETVLPRRTWTDRYRWLAYTDILAVAAGFLIIAISPIPPYLFQPVRVIAVYFIVEQLYYQGSVIRKLLFSVLLCGLYWLISELLASGAVVFLPALTDQTAQVVESATVCVNLCLMLLFRYRYRARGRGIGRMRLERYGYVPAAAMTAIMAVSMISWDGTTAGASVRLAAISGLAVICVCVCQVIVRMLGKEEELSRLALLQERTQNEMSLYRSMQKEYERQKSALHDYKNQLNCILGMLEAGDEKEARDYVAGLAGSLKKHADHINTGHAVVNVVLNQKYQEASEQGIVMILNVCDLSGLMMREEDLVTLLVNLLDNAIEACCRLQEGTERVIWFQMVKEEGQMILSVRNPVDEPVEIRGKTLPTRKQGEGSHGIGLLNVDGVVQRYGAVSALRCEGGFFSFSAVFDLDDPA